LQKDDFIVDDGISGYMDNGMEDWMEEDQQDESEEEYDKKRKSMPVPIILTGG